MRKTFSSRSISSVIAARSASRNCIWDIGVSGDEGCCRRLTDRVKGLEPSDVAGLEEVRQVPFVDNDDAVVREGVLELTVDWQSAAVRQHDDERLERFAMTSGS